MSMKLVRILLLLLLGAAALGLVIALSGGTAAASSHDTGRYQATFSTDKNFLILDTATGRWEHYTMGNRIYVIEGSFQGTKYDWHYIDAGQQKRHPG